MGIAKFCNIACRFCYGFYQKPKPVFIKREALLQTVKDAAEIGVKSLAFIGDGEPTCNPACYEALELGKKLGLDMSISTNGILVNSEAKQRAILESCVWMRFCFSAGTKEGYKDIHGKDKFDEATRVIREMVELRDKHNIPCEIGMQAVFVPTLMVQEMIEESKLAVKLGVDYLVIKQCSLPDDGSSGMSFFDVNEYDKPEIDEALKLCESLSTERTEIIPKWKLIKQKGEKPYEYCSSISLISEMSGNGDWYPCGYMFGEKPEFERYKFGNVHEKSLKEIWESERYWEIVEHMEKEFNVQTQCQGCCRQDASNEFCFEYLNPPKGINFI
jgi:radical SAM protein with 4Fe4S-binding SPASM domain